MFYLAKNTPANLFFNEKILGEKNLWKRLSARSFLKKELKSTFHFVGLQI